MIFLFDLLNGYDWYLYKGFVCYKEIYEYLVVYGQKLEVMVIFCCDSCVMLESIFGVGLGELFVVCNVVNLVLLFEVLEGQYGISVVIEYGVMGFYVKYIVVMGYVKCGGIYVFCENVNIMMLDGGFIGFWIKFLELVVILMVCMLVDQMDDLQLVMEYVGVCQLFKNLMIFSFVQDVVECGELQLYGVWFDIGFGELWVMDLEIECFEEVVFDFGMVFLVEVVE